MGIKMQEEEMKSKDEWAEEILAAKGREVLKLWTVACSTKKKSTTLTDEESAWCVDLHRMVADHMMKEDPSMNGEDEARIAHWAEKILATEGIEALDRLSEAAADLARGDEHDPPGEHEALMDLEELHWKVGSHVRDQLKDSDVHFKIMASSRFLGEVWRFMCDVPEFFDGVSPGTEPSGDDAMHYVVARQLIKQLRSHYELLQRNEE
jgi:hypothetical protein